MYTFRVLNINDYDSLRNNGIIIAKKPLDKDKKFMEALKQVGSHVQNGSNKDSAWISTSSSFKTVMSHYAVPYPEYQNAQRDLVVVLKNLNNTNYTTINNSICNSNTQLKNMNPVVMNLSDDNNRKKIAKDGYLVKTNGERYNKPSSIGPGLKYARKSKEILVLNEINQSNIVYILNPLEMDLVYALDHENYNIDSIIDNGINYNVDNLFTKQESIFYKYFFIKDRFLCDIVDDIMKENGLTTIKYAKNCTSLIDFQNKDNIVSNVNTNIDVLNIYAYVREMKRTIIMKILNEMGYQIAKPKIVDDNIHILRVGKVNMSSFLRISALKYNNTFFNMPNVKIIHKDLFYDDSLNHKTYPYCYIYDTKSFDDDNFYWLETSYNQLFITDEKNCSSPNSLKKKLIKQKIIIR